MVETYKIQDVSSPVEVAVILKERLKSRTNAEKSV
jgi:hypothetical protein